MFIVSDCKGKTISRQLGFLKRHLNFAEKSIFHFSSFWLLRKLNLTFKKNKVHYYYVTLQP